MKDRTTVIMGWIDNGEFKSNHHTAFYKDFKPNEYWKLPGAAQCEETKKEFDDFHRKQKEEIVSNKLITNLDRIHKRSKL